MRQNHTIIFFIIAFIYSINLIAQEPDTVLQYNLGEIVVEGKNQNLYNSSSIRQFEKRDIRERDVIDPTDAMRYSSGIYISENSRNEATINLRGYDQRQISIFVDGVPISSPYEGFIDLSNLPVTSIKKIKVSKSMPSLLYGPNSMGGTVNFITEESDETINADITLSGGARQNGGLSASGRYNKLFWSAGFNYAKSNGYELPDDKAYGKNEDGGTRENSQFEKMGGHVKIGLKRFHNFDLALSFMTTDNSKGVPTDIYSDFPRYWKFTEWKKNIANFMFKTFIGSSIDIRGNIFYEDFKNVLDSYDDSTFTTQTRRYSFHSTFDDHSYGGNLTTTYYSDFFQQLKLAVLYKKNVHKEQGNYDAPFKRYEADNLTVGIEDELTFGKFRTVIGASYDRLNPVYVDGGEVPEDISNYNGHFGLSYNLNETANLRFNLSRKSRFPTLKELYAEAGGRFIANSDLSTEHSVNTELGVRVNSFDNLEIDGAVFYNNVTDLIQVKFLPQSQRQFQNIGKVVFLGFETGMSWKSSDVSANVNYTFLNATNESDDAETDKLEYRPKHQVNLLGTYFWDYGIEITAEARLLADRYGINPNSRDFEKMDNYALLNAKIAKRLFNNYQVFLRVNNITNEYYETEYGFPQPGREIIFGAKASF